MNRVSIAGQALLWAGFLSGSLATVFSLENVDRPWATINWPWYVTSALICAVGIVVIRLSKKSNAAESVQSAAQFETLPRTIQQLRTKVADLKKTQDRLKPSEIVKFIDDTLADELREFVDARQAIVTHAGLHSFADVMTQFSAGERAINRAWSAAADGYVDEVAICLDRADTFFERTQQLLS
jgi:hypothetical protein